jgi:ribosome-binding ATPase YchF (GTP1/OBG family)
MFLLRWYKEWLNIRATYSASKLNLAREKHEDETLCQSCETLKHQLEIANIERTRLIERLLEKPEKLVESGSPIEISKPRMVPWNVRRQMLEREDREQARLMRNAPKPESETTESIAELEKEMGMVAEEREKQNASQ